MLKLKLHYFRDPNGVPNFGDTMNPWFWSQLLPEAFCDKAEALFVGVGTLIDGGFPEYQSHVKKVTLGAGAGYGATLPADIHRWHFYGVRGPHTAARVGLEANAAVGDPASLLPTLIPHDDIKRTAQAGYMPHYANMNSAWADTCEQANVVLVDPRWDVQKILRTIAELECLVTESLHGAIVADALRVPWVAVRTASLVNQFKWNDWCAVMGLTWQPVDLSALWDAEPGASRLPRLRNQLRRRMVARELKRIVLRSPRLLSTNAALENITVGLEERIQMLRSDLVAGHFAGALCLSNSVKACA